MKNLIEILLFCVLSFYLGWIASKEPPIKESCYFNGNCNDNQEICEAYTKIDTWIRNKNSVKSIRN